MNVVFALAVMDNASALEAMRPHLKRAPDVPLLQYVRDEMLRSFRGPVDPATFGRTTDAIRAARAAEEMFPRI